jgi:hypothetical protein
MLGRRESVVESKRAIAGPLISGGSLRFPVAGIGVARHREVGELRVDMREGR